MLSITDGEITNREFNHNPSTLTRCPGGDCWAFKPKDTRGPIRSVYVSTIVNPEQWDACFVIGGYRFIVYNKRLSSTSWLK